MLSKLFFLFKGRGTRRPPAIYSLITIFCACMLIFLQPTPVSASSVQLPAFLLLSDYQASIPIDGEFQLIAISSNGKLPRFSSSKSSIASVNTYGVVTGKKSGTCTITAKISGAEASCRVTVEKTTVTLSKTTISMENGTEATLSATVSTGHDVVWRSSSSATVSVDEEGVITAKKCGSATIRATVDGVTAKCKVTVRRPTLSLSPTKLSLYPDDTYVLSARCSSNRPLTWRSSSSATVGVDENGRIYAYKKGTATITVKVDGVSRTCKVTVKAAPVSEENTETPS